MVPHGLLVSTQDPPAGARIAERWAELLDLAPLAERAGFASFHVPEHHAREDGYLPQPLVACAALAARTSTIGIGTALTVGPLRHPLHLAEEAAMVDVLSGGRLVLAVGIGNFAPEYELFEVPYADRGTRFDEFLAIVVAGLSGEAVTHDGRHYRVRDALVRPRPVQRPRPPVWVGAMSQAGARRAGRLGLPLLLDPLNTIADLEPLVATYRAEAERAGAPGEVVLMRWGWAGQPDEVREVWWPHVSTALWGYLVDIPRIDSSGVDPLGVAREPGQLDLERVAEDRLLAGTPAQVAALARAWAERLGADRVVVKLQGDTGPWGDDLRAAVERYGREVLGRAS